MDWTKTNDSVFHANLYMNLNYFLIRPLFNCLKILVQQRRKIWDWYPLENYVYLLGYVCEDVCHDIMLCIHTLLIYKTKDRIICVILFELWSTKLDTWNFRKFRDQFKNVYFFLWRWIWFVRNSEYNNKYNIEEIC